MNRATAVVLALATVPFAACRDGGKTAFFRGDVAAAVTEARTRNTLVMVEFFTDWCTWCRRLETETFADHDVRRELAGVVPVRLNAEQEGAELAAKLGVEGYPTVVFLGPEGDEVDRIVGYLPPDRFLEQLRLIRGGDTFAACLGRLTTNPADWDALQRAVDGLLERSDPEAAIARIEAYNQAAGGQATPMCRVLASTARAALQDRVYRRAAKLLKVGWDEPLWVPDAAGASALKGLVARRPKRMDTTEVARELRAARTSDARSLFEGIDIDSLPADTLMQAASFADRTGNYDLASDLYIRWYRADGNDATPEALNGVAWQLYLLGRAPDVALEMARTAYAKDTSPDIADTLARLLYTTGETGKAIDLQGIAAEAASGTAAEQYRRVIELMKRGEPLGDRPDFESFPWGAKGPPPPAAAAAPKRPST
jgi:thioredoxin-related protein